MLTLTEIINEYQMYEDLEFCNFIRDLESRYKVKNEIEFFNNLVNFSKNAGIPLHSWFKYREGYSNKLVNELLIRFPIGRNQIVLDPFCGSGTTLVEAGLMGYRSTGIDANPMSVEITNAKSQIYSLDEINKAKEYLSLMENRDFLLNDNIIVNYSDVFDYFRNDNLVELLNINEFINKEIAEEKIRTLFRAGYLSIIEECSERKRDGNGLKYAPSKVQNVKIHFLFKMDDILTDVANYSLNATGKAFWGTAVDMVQPIKTYIDELTATVGSIIFSPPYANSFDYFESYKLELRLGGFIDQIGKEGLAPFRKLAVRSFVSGGKDETVADNYLSKLASEIENAIPLKEARTGKKDARTRKVPKMIKGYFLDMEQVLRECFTLLDKGGHCSVVVDQSSYLGKIVPTDILLAFYGEQIGFEVKEIIICRHAKTSSQQMTQFPYLKNSLRESIVVLRKK